MGMRAEVGERERDVHVGFQTLSQLFGSFYNTHPGPWFELLLTHSIRTNVST